MASKEQRKTVVFVSGLSDEVDDKVLLAAFLPFGDIIEIHLPTDPTSHNQHRGFGFVEFEEADDALAAVDNMHFGEIYGQVIKVNLARPMRLKEGSSRAIWSEDAWLQKYAVPDAEVHETTDQMANVQLQPSSPA
ncbi:hypothetical protein BJ085DRAFT_28451 [Dimargaris cristalligena]|uniref:RRM domain-containing protein n=1 Tax=Dimargaris cristalligena TaxID=215637 RepID=A0A4P9ZN78_9FUNG|nr:hypothetical protein BJ085DRAFT_28451 [Dimargaris cristalligena]|eukprot:RKP34866.1 hypothetical protein BJ085DRAFT_28451 [Dimargaris cristalligena]